MNLETSKLHESKVHPGVTFKVKQLNQLERAKRDAAVLDHQHRLSDLLSAHGKTEDEQEKRRIAMDIESIVSVYLKPSIIRAGLLEVSGVTIDGQPATVDTLLAHAPDTLLEEIMEACAAGAGLTDEQQKN